MTDAQVAAVLAEAGLIDESGLAAVREEQARSGKVFVDTVLGLNLVKERDLLCAIGKRFGVGVITSSELASISVPESPRINKRFLREHNILPVAVEGGALKLAVADILDPYPIEAVKAATGLEVEPLLAVEGALAGILESCCGSGAVPIERLIEGIGEKELEEAALEGDAVEHLKDMAREAPIVNLVNIIITRALEKRASDIHIEPFESGVDVRYRIDGILYLSESLPRKLHPVVSSRLKIMAKLNIAERRLPQDGRIKYRALGREMDIRVSTVPTLFGESIVMRLLDPAGRATLENIGLSAADRGTLIDLISLPHGMMLVTGPTGSGKSTTLYASIAGINSREKKIITIEDPVEYNLERVNQIQVKPRIGLTFANGLRSVVRQDPDVIMIGEIRDAETAEIAIHSALTGHLLFSSLHTNDAPSAVARLQDMGVEPYLLASSLLGVLAQRLVRVICPACRTPYAPADGALEVIPEFKKLKDAGGRLNFYTGAGCQECEMTGYRGRTGIFEIMVVKEEIRELIMERKSSNVIRQKAVELGMTTLREDGWRKAAQGITTVEEVMRVTLD